MVKSKLNMKNVLKPRGFISEKGQVTISVIGPTIFIDPCDYCLKIIGLVDFVVYIDIAAAAAAAADVVVVVVAVVVIVCSSPQFLSNAGTGTSRVLGRFEYTRRRGKPSEYRWRRPLPNVPEYDTLPLVIESPRLKLIIRNWMLENIRKTCP